MSTDRADQSIDATEPGPRLAVFLSYAHADVRKAESMAAAFAQCGCEVWWDRHIAGGSAFAAEIEAALDRAELVAVLWSAASRESHWVRDEAGVGRDRGILLPFRLDATDPPLGFRQTQTLNLIDWDGDGRDPALLNLISGALASWQTRHGTAAPALPPPRPPVAPAAPQPPLIAVLPFSEAASAGLDPHFARALSEEILDLLAGAPGLRVLGRASTAQISAMHADPEFARERLGVAWLIEGSVAAAAAGGVTVKVRLIETRTGEQAWAAKFTRAADDLAALEADVFDALAARLAGRDPPASPPPRGAAPPQAAVTNKAYVDTLVARHLIRLRQPDSLQRARALASGAIETDPGHAPAHATRALATIINNYYALAPINNARAVARAARNDAEMAVMLDPAAAESHDALAVALSYSGERVAALAAAQRAVALNPGDAEARQHLGSFLCNEAQFARGIDQLRQAEALDPLWPIPVVSQMIAGEMIDDRRGMAATAEHFRQLSPDEASRRWVSAAEANAIGAFGRGHELSLAALALNPTLRYAAVTRDAAREALFLAPASHPDSRDLRALARSLANDAVDRARARGDAAWDGAQFSRGFSLACLAVDRGPELVALYRSRFDGAHSYAAAAPVIEQASVALAFALDAAGATAEAAQLRDIAAENLARARAGGVTASQTAIAMAALQAGRGDIDAALTTLEQGFEAQWWAVARGPAWIGELPLLAPLAGQPRFAALLAACVERINRERALIDAPPLAW
ncbi:MAG: TIR domain-containing protein [Alphaproteobacteria bacterium]|nr:TIR domain-containing protein [Alphaproteobacteria bacterium]